MRSVGAIVLAAGESSRFGQAKQLLLFRGESLVRRAVRSAIAGGCTSVSVVVGNDRDLIEADLRETPALIVENREWSRGLGTSIRCGLNHHLNSHPGLEAVLLLVCDQPFVDTTIVSALVTQWENSGKAMVACHYADTLGVPALFDRACFGELLALSDSSGAKTLIQSHDGGVAQVEFEKGAIDIDTPDDFHRLEQDG